MLKGPHLLAGLTMMRVYLVPLILLVTIVPAKADEADDLLARQLAANVRDPRLPVMSRITAARTLAKLGPKAAAAIPDLVTVLDRLRRAEQEPLQEAIIEALGQMGSSARTALPALVRASARSLDIDQAIKRSTELILVAPDDQDVEALTKQLSSRDASIRLRAAKALGALGLVAKAAVPTLVTTLADPDADVRRGAIAAIRLILPNAKPTEAIIRAIAADLTDPDAGMRLLAVRALGRIGPPAVVIAADLEGVRNDPDNDVRRAVLDTLNRISAMP